MMKKQLICNADDFGIGPRITDAIVDCHLGGIVTSTTLMANMPGTDYACQRAIEVPSLGVGIHLNITSGPPLSPPSEVPDLLNADGRFMGSRVLAPRLLYPRAAVVAQIIREYSAQIEYVQRQGIRPTHGDSHHGMHKRPAALIAFVRVCQRYGIPCARTHRLHPWSSEGHGIAGLLGRTWRTLARAHRFGVRQMNHWYMQRRRLRLPQQMIDPFSFAPRGHSRLEVLLGALRTLPPGISEVVVHPGYPDPAVTDSAAFSRIRAEDAAMCRAEEVRARVREEGIELCSFRAV